MKNVIIAICLLGVLLMACAKTAPTVGGDRDEHGCIGSAGYQWCDAEQKCYRPFEENCTTADGAILCPAGSKETQACTMEYLPVCGSDGKTYGNKCGACQVVDSYRNGECSSELFKVTYAGGFVPPEMSQTVFSVKGKTFTWTTLAQNATVTSEKTRELSDAELGELRDIIASIGTLNATYGIGNGVIMDAGYADIQVAGQQTRVDPNVDEAYPAELRTLRAWIQTQTDKFPDYQGRTYQTRDPNTCAVIKYRCDNGTEPFSDESGCGCGPTQELIACDHTAARGQMCIQTYDPVCAQVDNGVRCIKAPCPSYDLKTYSNSCEACKDEKVYGYTKGECQDTSGKLPA